MGCDWMFWFTGQTRLCVMLKEICVCKPSFALQSSGTSSMYFSHCPYCFAPCSFAYVLLFASFVMNEPGNVSWNELGSSPPPVSRGRKTKRKTERHVKRNWEMCREKEVSRGRMLSGTSGKNHVCMGIMRPTLFDLIFANSDTCIQMWNHVGPHLRPLRPGASLAGTFTHLSMTIFVGRRVKDRPSAPCLSTKLNISHFSLPLVGRVWHTHTHPRTDARTHAHTHTHVCTHT